VNRRRALALVPLAVLSIVLLMAPAATAKKGKKNANVFSHQQTVNLAIPDRPAGMNAPPAAPLVSTIQVPKQFKGRSVADVNVTRLQTTGSTAGSAPQLVAYLTAPGGRTLELFQGVGVRSLGPWTLDDESPVAICNASLPTRCPDPSQSLNEPFAGISNLTQNWQGLFAVNGNLTIFNGVSMKGTWTLRIADRANAATSTLNQWGIQIRAKVGK
jgi:hypothetical protein